MRRWGRLITGLAVGVLGVAAPACADDEGSGADGAGDAGESGGDDGADGGDTGDGGGDDGGGDTCASESPLRRISSSHYQNALDDMFPHLELMGDGPNVDLFLEEETFELGEDLELEGFTNNAAVQNPTSALVERAHRNSLSLSPRVFDEFDGTGRDCNPNDAACIKPYLLDLATYAWRHPLTDAERAEIEARWDAEMGATGDGMVAFAVTLQSILNSVKFLYMFESGEPLSEGDESGVACGKVELTDLEIATRLAAFLYDSNPDLELLDAAAAGQLSSTEGIIAQVDRMLADTKARRGIGQFSDQWLNLRSILITERLFLDEDVHQVEWYDEMTPRGLYLQAHNFSVDTILGDQTLGHYLTSNEYPISDSIRTIYGLEPAEEPPGDEWEDGVPYDNFVNMMQPANERAGILTMAGPMALMGHEDKPAPVLRGVFILDEFLCRPVGAPPPDVDTSTNSDANTDPISNRERYSIHRQDPVCAGCHDAIDGIGFAFEHYTQAGKWSDIDLSTDYQPAVDATGTVNLDGVDHTFSDAVGLMNVMAQSRDVHHCVAEKTMTYALGRSIYPADAPAVDLLTDAFMADEGRFKTLIKTLVTSETFTTKVVTEGGN